MIKSNTDVPCPEEQVAQSDSAGPIGDSEKLARLISREDYVSVYDRKLTAAAFQIKDLVEPERKGISLIRLDKVETDKNKILLALRNEAYEKNITVVGVAFARSIRNVQDHNGCRAFCLVDDAYPGFESHALLKLEKSNNYNEREVRILRNYYLLDLFTVEEWVNIHFEDKA